MKRAWLLVVALVLLSFGWGLAQEKTQITFWHAMGGWRIEVLERMAADFNAIFPQYEVVPEFKGGYRDVLNAAVAAAKTGAPPGVVQIFEVGTRMAIDAGIFEPAQKVIEECGLEVDWSQYIPATMSYYTIDGVVYSFPFNSSNPILYYNKDIFEKAGIELPRKPTFEDIYEAAKKIVEGGYATYGITWPVHSWFIEQWFAEQGQDLVDNENGQAGRPTQTYLLSDAAKRIFEWWGYLYKDGLYAPTSFEAWGEAKRNFLAQETAMLIYSTSDVANMRAQALEAGFHVATAYFPVPADVERHGVIIGGGSLWIAKDLTPEQKKAAAEFVLWMSSVAQTIRWHQLTGYFPIKLTAIQALEEEGWYRRFPDFRTAMDQLQETVVCPATKGAKIGAFLEVREYIGKAFYRMAELIDQGVSVEEAAETALREAKEAADRAICEYREAIGEPCP